MLSITTRIVNSHRLFAFGSDPIPEYHPEWSIIRAEKQLGQMPGMIRIVGFNLLGTCAGMIISPYHGIYGRIVGTDSPREDAVLFIGHGRIEK